MRFLTIFSIVFLSSIASAQTVSVGTASLSNTDCINNTSDVVSFTLTAETSTNTPTMQLFATQSSCPAVDSDATSVTLPDDAISLVSLRAVTDTDISGNTATLQGRDLAMSSCTVGASYTWNVCLYEFWQTTAYLGTATAESATASATIAYDALAPGAPQLTSVDPGDQHLSVTFTSPGDSDITNYQVLLALKNSDYDEAIAASATTDGGGSYPSYDCYPGAQEVDLGTATSGRVPADASVLQDGVTYVAQVRAVDSAGNVGPCSNPMDGTPQQIDDFWRLYKSAGGSGDGGCTTAGGAAGLLGLLGVALTLGGRIRKSRRKDGR